MPLKYQQGDYVQVVKTPAPWESSGESLKDRESYLEHVGIVVEVNADFDENGDMVLVRFPISDVRREETTQRNIEAGSLRLISRPYMPISEVE